MNSITRAQLAEITGPHFTNTADYDVVSQMMFPSVECFTNMLSDPFYRENVMPDDKNFADMSRTKYVCPAYLLNNKLILKQGCRWAGSRTSSKTGSSWMLTGPTIKLVECIVMQA